MKARYVKGWAAAFLLGVAWFSQALAQDVKIIDYKPDVAYPVRTAVGIVTQVEISPREKVKSYAGGLSDGWMAERRDNVFYFKPKNDNVDTNFVITTNMHTYVLKLQVVKNDWKALGQLDEEGVNYHIKFNYPDSPWLSSDDNAGQDILIAAVDARYNGDYDYAMSSQAAWLVPTKVYDDNKFSYIRLPDNISFPATFAREQARGEDFVINTKVDGNLITVLGVYPYLVLRHGQDVVVLRRNRHD